MIKAKRKSSHRTYEAAGGFEVVQSTSDMLVGFLFIFLILILVLAMRVEQIIDVPLPKSKNPQDPAALMVDRVAKKLQAAGVGVMTDPKSGVITLPADALFQSGKSDLSAQGQDAIRIVAKILADEASCFVSNSNGYRHDSCASNARLFEIETIFIEGHTDNIPLNAGAYNNWHLALDRARTVSDLLSDGPLGKYKNSRNQSVIAFSSYADARPIDVKQPAKNRRVELRFITSLNAQRELNNAKTVRDLIKILGVSGGAK